MIENVKDAIIALEVMGIPKRLKALENRPTAMRAGGGGGSSSTTTPIEQLKKDVVSATVTYVGTNADSGAATSATDWTLSKVTYSAGSYTRLRATDSWDNRLTASYS